MVERLISGGQTGVDRAALDVALALGIPCGGWCPKGRRAEDGPLPERYPLRETAKAAYPQRTEWNVRDSDGTLVLTLGPPDGGTALTLRLAAQMSRPVLRVDLREGARAEAVLEWVRENGIRVLNVAGPRESSRPGVYAEAVRFLAKALGAGGRD